MSFGNKSCINGSHSPLALKLIQLKCLFGNAEDFTYRPVTIKRTIQKHPLTEGGIVAFHTKESGYADIYRARTRTTERKIAHAIAVDLKNKKSIQEGIGMILPRFR